MTNGILDSGQKIVTNGLVLNHDAAQLRSYPTTGTVITDLSGNNNNGTLINGVGFNSGNGGSLVFDGLNDYVQTSINPISNNSSFTIETWVKFTNFNNGIFKPIVDCGNIGSGLVGYTLSKNNSNNLYIGINNGYVSISNAIVNNTWCHIIATANKITNYEMKIYVNGILGTQNGSATISTLTNSQTSIRIMSNYVSINYFQGNVSQTQIYNRALSAQEVLQNYNATKARFGL